MFLPNVSFVNLVNVLLTTSFFILSFVFVLFSLVLFLVFCIMRLEKTTLLLGDTFLTFLVFLLS